MRTYEVEIKSLLGSNKKRLELYSKMEHRDPSIKCVNQSKQLNHYFVGNKLEYIKKNISRYLTSTQVKDLSYMCANDLSTSVRSRKDNEDVILVLKSSTDNKSDANGVSRLELEIPLNISLDSLDSIIIKSGYEYQAKWSRERALYKYKSFNVCIDKNAGYGYLAEFEKIVHHKSKIHEAQKEIQMEMQQLDVEELCQERLARMFSFYNQNWKAYYGTDKIFIID